MNFQYRVRQKDGTSCWILGKLEMVEDGDGELIAQSVFLDIDTMEGTGGFMAKQLKAMFKKNLLTKLAAVLVSGGLRDFKKMMDAGEVGGTPLIGISKPVIKAHGSSDAFAIKNAIRQAQAFAASGIIEDITENIDHMRLRSE